MTAEVAIINRMAVALAADSAVTIGESKIYNTVNKLFTLSKHHPVGIMIYGNALYMGVPWETVIKLYREELGTRKFNTLEAYTRHFLRFLTREIKISASTERQRVMEIWWAYFREINGQCHRRLLESGTKGPLGRPDVNRIVAAVIKRYLDPLRIEKTLPQYRKISLSSISKRYRKEFDRVKANTLAGRQLTAAATRSLREFASLVLIKNEFRLASSGLVIAGFGDKEIFPSVCPVMCAGRLFGRLKVLESARISVTSKPDDDAYIGAYAQHEMVNRFMEGIDPAYSDYLSSGVETLMQKLTKALIDKSKDPPAVKARRKANAMRAVHKMVDDFDKNASRTRHEYFVRPILNIVALLPKEELAELAWSLVSITSLKRKISMDAETVGGPIDVAVISKGDGFIWIRRKHYFKPELNPSFLQKYLVSA